MPKFNPIDQDDQAFYARLDNARYMDNQRRRLAQRRDTRADVIERKTAWVDAGLVMQEA